MNDIAVKIEARAYQSPGRARAALSRSQLSASQKRKLGEAITLWENEGSLEPPVIGALPAAVEERPSHVAEVVSSNGHALPPSPIQLPVRLNLNAFIRARLTPYGVHVLYAARSKVPVPDDLLAKGGVWETTLAHFMIAFGEHLEGPDNHTPVEGFEIELTRLRP